MIIVDDGPGGCQGPNTTAGCTRKELLEVLVREYNGLGRGPVAQQGRENYSHSIGGKRYLFPVRLLT